MNGRPDGLMPDEILVWDRWAAASLVGVPLVSLRWPGAQCAVVPIMRSTDKLRWHLLFDHACSPRSVNVFKRLAKEHDEIHEDALWSHIILNGTKIHVHEEVYVDDELKEWNWE